MADTSAGGCVRSAAKSAVSTRPCASLSGQSSGASGFASASTRASASATGINAMRLRPRSIAPGLSAALLDQANALDTHASLYRLHHVVDGEAGDRDGGERLHLNTGLAGHLDGGAHG